MYDVTTGKWLISMREGLEIRLEFEPNGLDARYNYSEGSQKPNEDAQELELPISTLLLFLMLSGHQQRFDRKLFKNTTVQYTAYSK